MANNNDLLTARILDTPAGRQVSEAFITILFNTWDINKSADRAREIAE